ncbi:MAG: BA14K family protein [Mesorhizobium sp.]|uniref:BA14K family protein n=1 Tax=Mesorhizobium sp. TaxID=1871066 RepID=UPI000FE9321A|nr:MAG: BA14K family protein [Mesorhizobium sp.]RWK82701.1 MAG: BA14K family protein [Mesorhizobium sp.]RWL06508.1 MAG: BA14K family protein [Mesorhizobium sp.]
MNNFRTLVAVSFALAGPSIAAAQVPPLVLPPGLPPLLWPPGPPPLLPPAPDYSQRYDARHYNWYASRYRSYSAYDDTFQPHAGPRRLCRSPFD